MRSVWLRLWKGRCPYQCESALLRKIPYFHKLQPPGKQDGLAHTLFIHVIGCQPANADLEAVAECYTNRQQPCKPIHI